MQSNISDNKKLRLPPINYSHHLLADNITINTGGTTKRKKQTLVDNDQERIICSQGRCDAVTNRNTLVAESLGSKRDLGMGLQLTIIKCLLDMRLGMMLAYTRTMEKFIKRCSFICFSIQSLLIARDRTQDPMLISKVQVAERQFDSSTNSYKTDSGSQSFPGNLYSRDRYMPVPYNLFYSFWTSRSNAGIRCNY